MTEEMYEKLNDHLNNCLIYLNESDPIFVNQFKKILIINNELSSIIDNRNINYILKEGQLSFEEVFLLAREIIENIDKRYLESFDNLIVSGELNFDYDTKFNDFFNYDSFKNVKTINISRLFNYDDVLKLIHEYMHYSSIGSGRNNINKFLTEFISIYFEEYARNYLIETKKIENIKQDINLRIISTKNNNINLNSYITVLIAFEHLGNINNNTKNELTNIMKINNESFEQNCINLLDNLENNFEQIAECIKKNYQYVFGTILAFYALENVEFDKMVKLNNNINSEEYSLMSLEEVLNTIGVEMNYETLEKAIKIFESKIYIKEKTK